MVVNCDTCGLEFKFQYLLDRHKNRKYPCNKTSLCPYCLEDFSEKTPKQFASHKYRCRKKHNGVSKLEHQNDEISTRISDLEKELELLKMQHDTGNIINHSSTINNTQNITQTNNNLNIYLTAYDGSRGVNLLDMRKTLQIALKNWKDIYPSMIKEAHVNTSTGRNVRPQSIKKADNPNEDWEVFDGHCFVFKSLDELMDSWWYQSLNSLADLSEHDNIDERTRQCVKKFINENRTTEGIEKVRRDIVRIFKNAMRKNNLVNPAQDGKIKCVEVEE